MIATNPWSKVSAAEAQRSDLWQLNLNLLTNYLAQLPPDTILAMGLNPLSFKKPADITTYVRRVSIPATRIKQLSVIQASTKRNLHGYQDPVDSVRVDFLHSVGEPDTVYSLLQAWRALTRYGRGTRSGEPALVLPSAKFKPVFQFDLTLQLLQGTSTGDSYDLGASYTLEKCWLRRIQVGELNRSGAAQPLIITADVQPRRVVEG